MKNRLKVFRAEHNMSQDDLAKKTGVSRQAIHSIEKGKYTPNLELAFRIARAFNANIEDIFIYEEQENLETYG
ncbi:MAG TPA: helix-turn-helix transcriptional regulator [Candidatus Nanoarchaeia archaeon]|nr:helix-turn-helix transcriptional regulator [Candidatus Nanoarchaeia archaeon]